MELGWAHRGPRTDKDPGRGGSESDFELEIHPHPLKKSPLILRPTMTEV